MTLGHTLRSLRHRNFRLYFVGQFVSMTGTWMQTMAQMWLVYRLTHSSLYLGLVGFAGQAPVLVLGLLGGAAADRYDRRRLLIATQSAALLQALALGLLTQTGAIRVWHVFALAMLLGAVNVFDMPARQSFVVEMVDSRDDLGNAIAMNSFLVNASRMLGPVVAGFLVGFYGEGPCFLLNALSYVAVIASLLMMNVPGKAELPAPSAAETYGHVRDGLRYAWTHQGIRAILLLLAAVSLAGVPFITLIPVFSDQILNGGPKGVGWLMGATGVGALGGAIFLARRRVSEGLTRVAGLSAAGFGLSLILFSRSQTMEVSLFFMILTGWCMMTAFTGCNTLLQTLTSDAMRGRVMGLFSMTFMGIAPFGNLLAGISAHRVGAPATVAVGGVACALCAAEFLRRVAPPESASAGLAPSHLLGSGGV